LKELRRIYTPEGHAPTFMTVSIYRKKKNVEVDILSQEMKELYALEDDIFNPTLREKKERPLEECRKSESFSPAHPQDLQIQYGEAQVEQHKSKYAPAESSKTVESPVIKLEHPEEDPTASQIISDLEQIICLSRRHASERMRLYERLFNSTSR
jgi:hypothetical protein